MRERSYRTEGIVLRRIDFGEADRLLTLFTREYGKLRAVAKGARKPQSRKTGHVELFMRTRFQVARGRDLDIITQAEMIESYAPLRHNLVRTTYAAYAVELLDRFTAEEDQNLNLYNLLSGVLGWMAIHRDLRLVARFYELRLLSFVGFQPQLFRCQGSGEEIREEDQYFSAELGGLLSPGARSADPHAMEISAVAVKVLRYLQTRPWDTIRVLQLRPALHRELEGVMFHYLTYMLERNLSSVDFLHRLRREARLFAADEEE
jgi:DNA repair protein RecO (recombination protein O)